MPVSFDAKTSASYGAIPKGPAEQAPESGSFEEFLRGLGLKGESDPYRLDLAKFILVVLYIAGNFIRPFAQADSSLACALHNFVSIFTLPAFTMITGYLSMEMTRPRKRFLIAYLIIPYLVLQALYLSIVIPLYWRKSFRNNSIAPAMGEFSRNNGQFSYNYTPQPNWGPLSFFTPCGDTWYLLSLATFSMWRPYAVEFKNTIAVHVVIGCLMGYTTIDRFMTLHRTVVLMPYFLAGHMVRPFPPNTHRLPDYCSVWSTVGKCYLRCRTPFNPSYMPIALFTHTVHPYSRLKTDTFGVTPASCAGTRSSCRTRKRGRSLGARFL